jgi:hypothetical protein
MSEKQNRSHLQFSARSKRRNKPDTRKKIQSTTSALAADKIQMQRPHKIARVKQAHLISM